MPNRDNATTGSGLLNEVIEFHGGLNQWNKGSAAISPEPPVAGANFCCQGEQILPPSGLPCHSEIY